MRHFVNGKEGAGLPAGDLGVTRGVNVFETFRTYGRTPFGFAQHMARLRGSAAGFGIAVPDGLEDELLSYLEDDVVIRVMLTAGGNRAVEIYPVPQERIGRPVTVAAVDFAPPLGFVKHGSRAFGIAMARQHGVEEVLWTSDGLLLEGMRSNLIGVVDGQLVTPPADGRILDGVTRRAMRQVSPIREAPLRLQDCDELWLSSTLKELAPAVVDGRSMAGPVGRGLHQRFRAALPELLRTDAS